MPNEPTARVPPQDIEAERATLGAMLLEGEAAGLAVEKLVSTDFYRAAHRTIFQAICDVYDEGQQPDELIVRERIEAKGTLEKVGGADYIHELACSVPSAANVERYAEIVKEKAVARKLINACTASLREAERGGDIGDILDRAQVRMGEVTRQTSTTETGDLGSILEETVKEFERDAEHYQKTGQSIVGIPSGLRELDALTGGFDDGDYILIAGHTSTGKTALALNILLHVCCGANPLPALFCSIEMSKKQVGMRLLSAYSGVPHETIRRGTAGADATNKMFLAHDAMKDAPLLIDATPGLDIGKLRGIARTAVNDLAVKIICVDYLQIMGAERERTREREVAKISQGLKHLGRELNVPIVVLSQLSRGDKTRPNARPQLHDLRDSGSLEQDADDVIFVHRDKHPDTGLCDPDKPAVLLVAKQRNGPTGEAFAAFLGATMRFKDYHK